MEIRLPGTGTCEWCAQPTSMPARVCVVADPDVQDCLCDVCSDLVDQLKRSRIAERLAAEIGKPEPRKGREGGNADPTESSV